MNLSFRIAAFLSVWLVCTPVFAKPQEETVFLFQNRKVTVLVPDGFGFASNKSDRGIMTLELVDPKDRVRMQITFLPDLEGRFTAARTQKEFMNETFHDFVDTSVEKAMQFEELEPKTGSGTYCVFTDAKLVGKTKLPRISALHGGAQDLARRGRRFHRVQQRNHLEGIPIGDDDAAPKRTGKARLPAAVKGLTGPAPPNPFPRVKRRKTARGLPTHAPPRHHEPLGFSPPAP